MILFDLPEEIQDLLRAAHSKGRNNDSASPAECLPEDLGQRRNRCLYGFMQPCSVCGFDQQVISFFDLLRIIDDRLVSVSHVSAADKLLFDAPVFQEKFNEGGTKKMARVCKPDRQPFIDHINLTVQAGPEQFHRAGRVFGCIKRFHHSTAVAQVLFGFVCCIGFLDMGTVCQHDRAEVCGFRRGIHCSAESLLVEERQQTGMINMGMGQENVFYPGRRYGKL